MPRPAQRRASARTPAQRSREGTSRDPGNPAVPPRKTVKLHPAVALAIFCSPGIIFIIIMVMYFQRENPPPPSAADTDDNVVYQKIIGDMPQAKQLYMKAMSLRSSDDKDAFNQALEEARNKILDMLEKFNAILDPIRDPDTGELPDGYGQYRRDCQKLQEWLLDLQKTAGF